MAELEDLIYSGLISPRAAGRNGFEMPSAASASLGQTMPPEPVQEAIKGMAEPVTTAGWLLGGAMQGSQRPSTMDIIKAAGGLGLAAMPMGPGRASMLARGLETAADTAPTAIRAYHGSPYDFPAFDISKIGTGEGAQAYGHGLYFAEQEKTAKAYRDALKERSFQSKEGPVPYGQAFADIQDATQKAGKLHPDQSYQLAKTITDKIERGADLHDLQYVEPFDTAYRAGVAHAQERGFAPNPGKMYEVNIKAQPEQFLDWDKPLGQQTPQVIEGMHKAGWSVPEKIPTADELANLRTKYGDWGKMQADALEATMARPASEFVPKNMQDVEAAAKAGIPGIRYLDQGSRGDFKIFSKGSDQYGVRKPDGTEYPLSFSKEAAQSEVDRQNSYAKTHNYVVFNDKLIDIIKKYGLAGLIAGGAYHGQLPAKQGGT